MILYTVDHLSMPLCCLCSISKRGLGALQRRHNGRDGISNHQPHDCLLKSLFRRSSKKASKLRVTGPLWLLNSPPKGPVTRKNTARIATSSITIWYQTVKCMWTGLSAVLQDVMSPLSCSGEFVSPRCRRASQWSHCDFGEANDFTMYLRRRNSYYTCFLK